MLSIRSFLVALFVLTLANAGDATEPSRNVPGPQVELAGLIVSCDAWHFASQHDRAESLAQITNLNSPFQSNVLDSLRQQDADITAESAFLLSVLDAHMNLSLTFGEMCTVIRYGRARLIELRAEHEIWLRDYDQLREYIAKVKQQDEMGI